MAVLIYSKIAAMPAPLPDPLYYLHNFQTVLNWVEHRYADILTIDELDFIRVFGTLPIPSRALLVRMIMRKGTLFRASKLVYTEIGACCEATGALEEHGFIDSDPQLALTDLFALLTKNELLAIFADRIKSRASKKDQLLLELREYFPNAKSFAQWCGNNVVDTVFELKIQPLCDRVRLMFFGNLYQDWSEFVLSDLGIYRYEQVELTESSRAIQQRSDIDIYLHLHHCRERFESAEPIGDILAAIGECDVDNPWLESRRAKLYFRLAQACERNGDLTVANTVYADCHYAGARLRRVRVLERLQQVAAAHELALLAEETPESEAELQGLMRMIPRLRRKLGLCKEAKVAAPKHVTIDVVLPKPREFHSVEEVVRQHLDDAAAPAYYVENTLLNSLLGLLCWQVIFAPIPGAFFNPFQSSPVDLYSPEFYSRRAELFESYLAQLDSDEYRATIFRNFEEKTGIQSAFVFWGALDRELIELALDCIPAAHLRQIFKRILQNIKANRSGLPDLIQFWPAEKRYRMVEVKGPGDKLQDNQVRWLNYCAMHEIPVEVCYLQWQTAA